MNNDYLIKEFNILYKGKFKITEKLFMGHNGAIYKGKRYTSKTRTVPVAIKIKGLSMSMENYQHCIPAFLREAEIMQDIDNANVVSFDGNGQFEYDGNYCCFIVMELLDGYNLTQIVKSSLDQMPIQMPPKELKDFFRIAKWVLSAAQGLQAMHDKGIVHGDIKPDNLFVDAFDPEAIVIVDLGSANYEKDIERYKKIGNVDVYYYTKWFLSPERRKKKHPSRESDLYALGRTVRLLMTGTNHGRDTTIPQFFDWFILKAISAHQGKRFQSANEMIESLQLFLELESQSVEVKHE